MKKALITGMSGFVGHYLKMALELKGYVVYGTCLQGERYEQLPQYYSMNLLDKEQVVSVLRECMPDEIYHLAGQSSVALSWSKPTLTMDINVNGTINLLEVIKEFCPNTKVLIVGSSYEYGPVKKEDCPVNEEHPLNPVSPYGVSKMTQEKIAQVYAKAYGLNVVMVRPFNHVGAMQAKGFVVSDFASKVAAIEKGEIEPVLKVGNLHSYRDFTDVEDVVEAYTLLLDKGVSGEVYNVGSGKAVEIQEVLNTLINMSKKHITVKIDESLYRPVDVPLVVCDNTKLKQATGWEPKKELKNTLLETLNYWRNN